MFTIKNILVATDFSEASGAALDYGRQLAHAFGATLHLLHVVGNVVGGAIGVEGYTTDFVALQREVEEAARKQLDSIVTAEDLAALGVKTVTATSSVPASAIVSYAKAAEIDLVIVGTHGHGDLTHLKVGSVAERVALSAPCPVLTVRHAERKSAPAEPLLAAARV